ncbi:hypothetical protein P8452_36740 [Trifolium repens]|nr:hypothetical protein P8452_36740 [Trifolium repens]
MSTPIVQQQQPPPIELTQQAHGDVVLWYAHIVGSLYPLVYFVFDVNIPFIPLSLYHSGHGSIGPVIAVLAIITVLGIIAGMIGRLCSGRRVMGYGEYDIKSWVETKCSSCVGGRIVLPPPPPPPPPPANEPEAVDDSQPVVVDSQEMKEDEQSRQQSRQSSLDHSSS